MRIVLKMLKWTGISILAVICLFLVINAFDESLDKDMAAFADISEKGVKEEENAYYTFLMFHAPPDADAHKMGVEAVKAANEAIGKDPETLARDVVKKEDRLNFIGDEGALWKASSDAPILAHYREKAGEAKKLIRDNKALLERYDRLRGKALFHEPALTSVITPWPQFNLIKKTHELKLAESSILYNSGDRAKALKMLKDDTAFWRKVLKNASTLIVKISAVKAVKDDLTLFAEFIERARPGDGNEKAFHTAASAILYPLDQGELSFEKPVRSEFVYLKMALEDLHAGRIKSEKGLLYYLVKPFFKIHATLNRLYASHARLARTAGLSGREFTEAVKKMGYREEFKTPSISIDYVYNPIGKLYVAISEPSAYPYMQRTLNLDGLMRLISLKLALKEKRVKDIAIEGFIKKGGERFTNPYTGEPVKWDAQSKTVYFYGMDKSFEFKEKIWVKL